VGAHTAEATERGADYTGHGVHVAARVAATAGPSQIVASQDVIDVVGEDFTTTDHRTLELKGVSKPVDVATIVWQ
jgi:class 3 adenylate cyclase